MCCRNGGYVSVAEIGGMCYGNWGYDSVAEMGGVCISCKNGVRVRCRNGGYAKMGYVSDVERGLSCRKGVVCVSCRNGACVAGRAGGGGGGGGGVDVSIAEIGGYVLQKGGRGVCV